MKKLIELFFSVPNNNYQEVYRDYEGELLSGDGSAAYCKGKMLYQVERWIDTILAPYNMDISLDHKVCFVSYENRDIEIPYTEMDRLIKVIEDCRNGEFSGMEE